METLPKLEVIKKATILRILHRFVTAIQQCIKAHWLSIAHLLPSNTGATQSHIYALT